MDILNLIGLIGGLTILACVRWLGAKADVIERSLQEEEEKRIS